MRPAHAVLLGALAGLAGTASMLLYPDAVLAAPLEAAPIVPPASIGRLDRALTDQTWTTLASVDGFSQREPREGDAPSQRTAFRIAYDDGTLYVQVHAFDTEPDRIVGYLTRRDAESPSDWIRVLVDSYHDRRTAYEFAVNPLGVKQDRYWYNDTNRDDSWDAVWDVAVRRDTSGWMAEFRIPLSQLRFNPASSITFGFAVSRDIGRLNETSTWPLLPRSATGYVSSFGDLPDLRMNASPRQLELVPYAVASVTTQPSTPVVTSPDPSGAGGMDVRYALTPGLMLTGTVNPDFGQVEADPAVVNLTAFETFFAERRPFFIEGTGAFRFDSDCLGSQCLLFYSRRVGRDPQQTGDLPDGDDTFTAAPTQTTILGAAKLTGRVGRWAMGAMYAATAEETASVLESGLRSQSRVEPRTDYTVVRGRREFANQSSVGAMTTIAARRGLSESDTLPAQAYVGGLDWDLRARSHYSITGYLSGSRLQGSADAIGSVQESSRHYFQRPDARSFHLDSTRRSLQGWSGRIGLSKVGGQHLRFNANVGAMSPGYDVNDVGFLRRADQRWVSNWLQVRSDTPNRWARSRTFNVNQWAAWNADGDRIIGGHNVIGIVQFTNNWTLGVGVGRDWTTLDDRLTRGGPSGYVDGSSVYFSWLDSDKRQPVSVNLFNGGGRDGHGTWRRDHEINVTFRPTQALSIAPGLRINRAVRDAQWVDKASTTADHYVFGHLDQTTVALTGRVNFTVTANFSLELYAQPFVSGGAYSAFKELIDGRRSEYEDRYAAYAWSSDSGDDPDFNVKSFRTTNVARWEFKPGSTLFVVWQQGREQTTHTADFRVGRDVGRIFDVPARNVFLVKLAYWFNH